MAHGPLVYKAQHDFDVGDRYIIARGPLHHVLFCFQRHLATVSVSLVRPTYEKWMIRNTHGEK